MDEMNEKERYWIAYYKSNDKTYGYNLDSGGKSGGKKSESTKQKIGLTTIEKWNNPEIAEKMRAGLIKGSETMKKNVKRYPFICPVCGKTFYYEKWVANKKKYCSNECTAKSGNWKIGIEKAAELNHARNVENKSIISQDVVKWIMSNKDTVLKCPYNKITNHLNGLVDMLKEKHGIKDLRSIFICFGVKNKKELLDKFKEMIINSKENVC